MSHPAHGRGRGAPREDHCTDVYAVARSGYREAFALGHNEDWSEAVKPFWYWVNQSVQGAPRRSPIRRGMLAF